MATIKIYPNDIKEVLDKYKDFQLCYIDSVPETYYDLTPESRKLSETPEYIEYRKQRQAYLDNIMKQRGSYSSRDWEEYDFYNDPERKFRIEYQDYPTEDIVNGYTHYIYFTNNMKKQWGDDWDDAPYEHNAEVPYDDETDILQIPVCITYYKLMEDYDEESYEEILKTYPNYNYTDLKLPKDWGSVNSPFCVDDINGGAVAWLYATLSKDRYVTERIVIHAGETPQSVLQKIEDINGLLTLD